VNRAGEPGGHRSRGDVPGRGRWLPAAIALVVIVVLAVVLAVRVDPEALVQASGPLSRLAFVLLVVTEVVLAPIPGGVIAFLASAAWGFWQSWPLHYVGNVIGGLLVFWLARSLGRPFVDRHVPARRRELIERRLFGRPWLVWIVYAIPIFPIDTVSIALGVSGLDRRKFALILVTALPFYTGITAALGAYFGRFIPYLEWFGAAVLVVFVMALVYAVFALRRQEAPEGGGSA
jgi:uncharacterized membrane protein YdjX (TVP38/TMEM64 family)